jgi:hypothetical protein
MTTNKRCTPKRRVIAKHPGAFCETNGDIGYQIVVVGVYGRAEVLGQASTSKHWAWKDAARKIEAVEGFTNATNILNRI